jgi:ABC-type uncharacterized transport system substrate-binding protein
VDGAFDQMMDALRACLPGAQRIGTLFVPAEVNSVYYKGQLEIAARKAGLALDVLGVNTSSEVPDAAASLCSRPIDAVCQISDNLSSTSFAGIAQAVRKAGKPLFSFSSSQARQGSAVVIARDYQEGGKAAGLMAASVMRGRSPATMPFQPTTKTKISINLDAARAVGLTIPPSLVEQADEVIGR